MVQKHAEHGNHSSKRDSDSHEWLIVLSLMQNQRIHGMRSRLITTYKACFNLPATTAKYVRGTGLLLQQRMCVIPLKTFGQLCIKDIHHRTNGSVSQSVSQYENLYTHVVHTRNCLKKLTSACCSSGIHESLPPKLSILQSTLDQPMQYQ